MNTLLTMDLGVKLECLLKSNLMILYKKIFFVKDHIASVLETVTEVKKSSRCAKHVKNSVQNIPIMEANLFLRLSLNTSNQFSII